jgi:hypothetical protein
MSMIDGLFIGFFLRSFVIRSMSYLDTELGGGVIGFSFKTFSFN